MTALHIDSSDNVWFANSDGGLYQYDEGLLKKHTKILEDRDGDLWFVGDQGQTLIRYDRNSFQNFPVTDTTGAPVIIHQDNDGGIAFIFGYETVWNTMDRV